MKNNDTTALSEPQPTPRMGSAEGYINGILSQRNELAFHLMPRLIEGYGPNAPAKAFELANECVERMANEGHFPCRVKRFIADLKEARESVLREAAESAAKGSAQ